MSTSISYVSSIGVQDSQIVVVDNNQSETIPTLLTFQDDTDEYRAEIRAKDFIADFFDVIYILRFYLAVFGFLANFPHFLVLVNRKMRNSSVNVMMAGIAFCDVFTMLPIIVEYLYERLKAEDGCPGELMSLEVDTSPDVSLGFQLTILFEVIGATLLRASPWLGLTMALIRVVVLTFPMNGRMEKLSDASAGLKVLLGVLAVSGALSAYAFSTFKFIGTGTWEPRARCGFYPGYDNIRYTVLVVRRLLFFSTDTSMSNYSFLHGLSIILPAFLYPLLTIILILQFANAKVRQSKLTSSGLFANQRTQRETNQKTKLVILMTFTFFLSQSLNGATALGQHFYQSSMTVFSVVLDHENELNTVLLTLNATSHCLIFAVMSSNYRKVAREMFVCRRADRKMIPVKAVTDSSEEATK